MSVTGIIADSSRENSTQTRNSMTYPIDKNITPNISLENALNNLNDHNISAMKNNRDEMCINFTPNKNISKMDDHEIKSKIQSQAKYISNTYMNITKGFQEVESIASEFALYPNEYGSIAINLGMNYLKSSQNILNSVREHNLLIRALKCISKSKYKDILEISEEKIEDTLKHNENVLSQLYYLNNLSFTHETIYNQNEKYKQSMAVYNSTQKIEDLNMALTELKNTVSLLKDFVNQQDIFISFMRNNNLNLYDNFQTGYMLYLTNIQHWKKYLQDREEELKIFEQYASNKKFENLLHSKIQPTVHGLIFAVGFVGNVVLLIIFIRHKEMRNPPSMMILNLTLADAFNLPVNIPVFLIYLTSHSWNYGEVLCIAFRFLRQLGITVSIYSIVVISIQRFLALTQIINAKYNGWCPKLVVRLKSILLIVSVWIIGSLIATPHTINAGIYDGQCYGAPKENNGYDKFITLFDFVLFCGIPLTIIATLSIATALLIRKSVRNIPGESMGMDKYIKTRIVSANVLIALTVVSAASYFPYYLFMFLYAWKYIQINTQEFQITFFITYTFVFANCCFNPIALYIFSGKFRKYFQKYLFCKTIESFNNARKMSSGTTTSTFIIKT
ncbi:hypothetical protein L9F63_003422 [Diploptera punctata]|uniref:G-protein coupled receptors family 1 profile domain-containing protein n=1 Tax=Diploptera punctata TaxID=6984 RepID=A0AAD7ZLW7_DIPPU|nr:hypothetical protein L9F63_003422 [Diploptera punctata]